MGHARDDQELWVMTALVVPRSRLAFLIAPSTSRPVSLSSALLLATGQFGWEVMQARREAHKRNRFLHRHRISRDVRHQPHVFSDIQAGNEVVELENEAHMLTPISGEFVLQGTGPFLIAKPRRAAGGSIKAAQNGEEHRFPQARGAKKDDELALRDIKISTSRKAWTAISPEPWVLVSPRALNTTGRPEPSRP
jgi:hypothetical protein